MDTKEGPAVKDFRQGQKVTGPHIYAEFEEGKSEKTSYMKIPPPPLYERGASNDLVVCRG